MIVLSEKESKDLIPAIRAVRLMKLIHRTGE